MEKEYLSIKDFAFEVGISQQAIYKQLNNKLKTYLKTINGKKMIEKSALSLYKKNNNSIEVEQKILNILQTELNEKNQQLAEKDKQIAELQKLLDQSQKLHAMDKQKILELEEKKQDVTKERKWFKWF